MPADFDAIAIGAGHNALVAANLLAEQGWSVLVLEAEAEPGGAVKSGEITEAGFTSDLFSAFYPLAAASPAIRALELERYGLRCRRAPIAVAHPQPDGACAVVSTDLDESAASVERFAPGDGDRWRELYAYWRQAGEPFMDALLRPSPPLRGGARLAATLGRAASCASRSYRSAGSPRSASAATAPLGCWPATRCMRTSCRRPTAAACSAGCCAAWASSTASRHRRAAPAG